MKRISYFGAIASLVMLALVSCQKEESGRHLTFSAVIERPSAKTAINQVNTGDNNNTTTITWVKGDVLSIYDGTEQTSSNNPNKRFSLISISDNGDGMFDGEVNENATTFVGVYPYAKNYTFALNNTANPTAATVATVGNIVIPSGQTPYAGSYDPQAGVMTGFCADNGTDRSQHMMYFKNLCALIKVTPQFDCSEIVVTSSGDPLAGTVSADVNIDPSETNRPNLGTPSNITVQGTTGANTVVLQGNIVAGQTYYIAVLPGTYQQLTFQFIAKAGHNDVHVLNENLVSATVDNQFLFVKSTLSSSTIALASAQILNLPDFPLSTTVWDYTYGLSQATDEHGYGYCNLDLPSHVLWATQNVGATTVSDTGTYYAWGETWAHYTGSPSATNFSWLTNSHGHDYSLSVGGGYSFNSYHYCDSTGIDANGIFVGANTNGPTGGTSAIYDANGVLLPAYDVATQLWGSSATAPVGTWRMPTQADFQELISHTGKYYIKDFMESGVSGFLLLSPSRNHGCIFMPVGGTLLHGGLRDVSAGFYWSSNIDATLGDNKTRAYFLRLEKGNVCLESRYRINGRLVRPVMNPAGSTGTK